MGIVYQGGSDAELARLDGDGAGIWLNVPESAGGHQASGLGRDRYQHRAVPVRRTRARVRIVLVMADAREGLAAVIERRKPIFTGR